MKNNIMMIRNPEIVCERILAWKTEGTYEEIAAYVQLDMNL